MTRTAAVALALAALVLCACKAYDRPSRLEVYYPGEGPVYTTAHEWLFYPQTDVYHCTAHRHYWFEQGGGWVWTDDLAKPPVAGVPVEVDYQGDDPYVLLSVHRAAVAGSGGHDWVYGSWHRVYHCRTHGDYLVRSSGTWVSRPEYHCVGPMGPWHEVSNRGPTPYDENLAHRDRWGYKYRGYSY